jgi:transcriptional regulator with XRE-family HTH domain
LQYRNRPRGARFDQTAFYSALDTERQARGLTWKDVARDTGVSASTLSRMSTGRRPDVDGLAALASWSGLDADDFIRSNRSDQGEVRPGIPALVSSWVRRDPDLTLEGAAALEEMFAVAYRRLRRPGQGQYQRGAESGPTPEG